MRRILNAVFLNALLAIAGSDVRAALPRDCCDLDTVTAALTRLRQQQINGKHIFRD